MGKEGWG